MFRLLLPPTITLEPHSQTNGAGATVTFRVGATSLNPMGYQWQKNGTNLANGGNMSGETTNTLSITGISDSDSGTYTVILTNLYGITVSSNAVLEVLDLPFIVTQPLSQTVDLGGSVTFSAQANGVPPFVFEWCFNGTPVASSAPGTNYSVLHIDQHSSQPGGQLQCGRGQRVWQCDEFQCVADGDCPADAGIATLGRLSAAESEWHVEQATSWCNTAPIWRAPIGSICFP